MTVGIQRDVDIRQLLASGQLVIEPFDEEALQPTSYDLSLDGELPMQSEGKGASSFEVGNDRVVAIAPKQFKLFLTSERLELPLDLVGDIVLRSSYQRRGLMPGKQGLVEAGWRGRLVIELFNATASTIILHKGERVATVRFMRLEAPVQDGYKGRFKDQ